jgi:hypothetical protein
VQVASKATNLPSLRWTSTPGSPLVGIVNVPALVYVEAHLASERERE